MNESAVNFDNALRIGQLVKLYLEGGDLAPQSDLESAGDEDHAGGVRGYSSVIQDVLPDNIVIAWPTDPADRKVQIPVSIGQQSTLEIKCNYGILRLDSQIVARKPGDFPLLHIARRGDWSRSQLRENVRLEVTIVPEDMRLVWRAPKESEDGTTSVPPPSLDELLKSEPRGEPISAVIRDLSAGGVLLGVATHLRLGSIVKIKFPSNDGLPDISAFAKVVWVGEDEGAVKHSHEAGCQFLNIGMREQDNITKFIFAKQVEFRRRGLM